MTATFANTSKHAISPANISKHAASAANVGKTNFVSNSEIKAYYKLDGNSNDSLGVNNGVDTSMTYSTSDGKVNQGAHFSGSGRINKTSASGLPTGAGARTIAFWFKGSSTAEQALVMWGSIVTGQGCLLQIVASPVAGSLYFAGFGTGNDLDSGINIADGSWHFCAFTFDGVTGRIYTDNVLRGSAALSLNTTGTNLAIGARNDGSELVTGSMDEVGIWGRVLTADELSFLYNAGTGNQFLNSNLSNVSKS